MPNGNIFYICKVFENSVSYGVSVERNRQILETGHIDRYVRIGVLFSIFSVSRGVWRCLFYLKEEGVRCFYFQNEDFPVSQKQDNEISKMKIQSVFRMIKEMITEVVGKAGNAIKSN